MQTLNFGSREEWLAARMGKITGTRLKDVIWLQKNKTGFKAEVWKLIAERVALPPDGENAMDRGLRLEEEALLRFNKETGKKFETDLVMWVSDDDENIAVSPDGWKGQTEAAEVKCLNSATHIEALITQKVPQEYHFQVLQYFIVNSKLQKLHLVFYDPRIPKKDFFYFTINREEVEAEIEEIKIQELEIIRQAEEIINQLTF